MTLEKPKLYAGQDDSFAWQLTVLEQSFKSISQSVYYNANSALSFISSLSSLGVTFYNLKKKPGYDASKPLSMLADYVVAADHINLKAASMLTKLTMLKKNFQSLLGFYSSKFDKEREKECLLSIKRIELVERNETGNLEEIILELTQGYKKLSNSADREDACPECNSKNLNYDEKNGELSCSECGYVKEENIIDTGQDWRAFDASQQKQRARTGLPATYTLHDKGLSTTIGRENKDYSGKAISAEQRPQIYRLRKWQKRTSIQNATDRNLTFAITFIGGLCSQMQLPDSIKESSCKLYRSAVEKHLIRGRSIEDVACAAVHLACRNYAKEGETSLAGSFAVQIKDIARASGRKIKLISKSERIIMARLNVSVDVQSPVTYISRLTSAFNLPQKVYNRAAEIIEKAKGKGITIGKDPAGLAAAAVYLAGLQLGENRTQRNLAKEAKVTEVTVRNRYKELEKLYNFI